MGPGAPFLGQRGGGEQLMAAAAFVKEHVRDERNGDVVIGLLDYLDTVPGGDLS